MNTRGFCTRWSSQTLSRVLLTVLLQHSNTTGVIVCVPEHENYNHLSNDIYNLHIDVILILKKLSVFKINNNVNILNSLTQNMHSTTA